MKKVVAKYGRNLGLLSIQEEDQATQFERKGEANVKAVA